MHRSVHRLRRLHRTTELIARIRAVEAARLHQERDAAAEAVEISTRLLNNRTSEVTALASHMIIGTGKLRQMYAAAQMRLEASIQAALEAEAVSKGAGRIRGQADQQAAKVVEIADLERIIDLATGRSDASHEQDPTHNNTGRCRTGTNCLGCQACENNNSGSARQDER